MTFNLQKTIDSVHRLIYGMNFRHNYYTWPNLEYQIGRNQCCISAWHGENFSSNSLGIRLWNFFSIFEILRVFHSQNHLKYKPYYVDHLRKYYDSKILQFRDKNLRNPRIELNTRTCVMNTVFRITVVWFKMPGNTVTVCWFLVLIILSCQDSKIILMFVRLQMNCQISFCRCWITTNFATVRFVTTWICFASCQSRVRSRFTTKSTIWISFISGCHYYNIGIATTPIATFATTIIIWFHISLFNLVWF